MIANMRVGIPIIGGKGWLGGVSHIEMHVKAVACLPKDQRPQLFLVATDETLASFDCYRPFAALFDGIIFWGKNAAKAVATIGSTPIYCSSEDELFQNIDFFFPVNFNVLPGRCAASWIHDFQHRHLPDFFSQDDITMRDRLCDQIAKHSRLVFCSSRAVEKDFWRFYPDSPAITRVLSLQILPESNWYAGDPPAVQAKYGLPDKFVLCSNQFWLHKNHRLLFAAIALLRQAGQDVHLVCTGLTSDFRRPGYYEELQQYIDDLGVSDLIHILGLIPRHDQIQLLRRSLFVVQPSLFEGLSLIVPECKALGKAIILSDLAVHFEHQYGIYFQRSNAEDLAQKISALLPVSQPGPDKRREAEARLQAAGLAAAYGREFCRLATEAQAIFARKTVSPAPPQTAASLPDTKLITLATSLRVTEDPRSQHKAIASWLKLGFQVISVNATEDISTLAPIFPSVRFIAAERDVIRQNGKSGVYYDELLSVLDRHGTRICGLAEPDTYFCQKLFHSLIAREAPCSLIYGSTIDIEALSAPKASSPPRFGFCFFDRQLIPYYPAEDFRIGLPWWDYWAVLIAAARNFTLKKLVDPVAFRVRETTPDLEDWVSFGNRLAKYAPPTFSLSAATLTNYAQQLSVILGKRSKTVLS